MRQRWVEMQQRTAAAGLRVVPGRPTFRLVDLLVWDPDDLAGWVDAAVDAGARLVYAADRTFEDRAEVFDEELEEVDFELADDVMAEVDAISDDVRSIGEARRGEQVCWSAEWRAGGVAHVIGYLDDPPEVAALFARLAAVRAAVRVDRRESFEQRRRREQVELFARFDAAAAALAEHPGFSRCKNFAERKNLMKRLAVDTEGLNKEEVISEATRLLRVASSPAQLSLTDSST